ncbi:DEAD/DEAH box helicase [Bizionia sediminis]|uniref:DEAD/DEAH box helicase n=1 Tax=Bizionia sediminis TaxID=1737064 RepID=A0ABW5KSV9_9FLAO
MTTFAHLGIQKEYVKALKELNIIAPTAIQAQTIPILLNNQTDFIGLAQTGTGKTAAYGLPLLHIISPLNLEVQALILAPTRELVQQIKKQLFKFTKYCNDSVYCEGVYGGEKIDRQIKALKRPSHIVVATPGRLLDLIERDAVNIKQIQTLILDEADEMLSMGFKNDLNKILKYATTHCNTWLFSATMPPEIQSIVKTYMSPKTIKIAVNKQEVVNTNISHQFVRTALKRKETVLISLLDQFDKQRGIVFCNTKASTQNVYNILKNEGFLVGALEGDMPQKERDKVMRAFKNERIQILISTDVSARGIDVSNLAFVIHHQLPEQAAYYTHRSGRTARAGKKGRSIALILDDEQKNIQELEKKLGIQFTEFHR